MSRYPGIERAALLIALDNGGIHVENPVNLLQSGGVEALQPQQVPSDQYAPPERAAPSPVRADESNTERSMKRVIYLSGPISGMPGKNHDLFMRVAQELRRDGHEVYNPREFCWTEDVFPKRKAFAAYCDFICNRADTIVLLPGWQGSKGATTEHGLAENCGIEIIEWSTWEVREKADVVDNLLEVILADDAPVGPEDAENLRLFQRATEDGKAHVAKAVPFVDDVGGGP